MIQDNPMKKYWLKTEEKPKMEIKNNFSHQLMAWHGKTNDFATITFFPFPPFGGTDDICTCIQVYKFIFMFYTKWIVIFSDIAISAV